MISGKQLQQCPCSRRSALKFGAGVACGLASGMTLSGCGEATLDDPVTLAFADYPELDEIGGIAKIPTAATDFKFPIFVHRRGEEDYVSFSSECTHFGCEIELGESNFECPCHGSTFDLDGNVTGGPAKQNLVHFDVTVDDTTFTLSP